jgi:predicted enzyme related to lactoylglutathione lyase
MTQPTKFAPGSFCWTELGTTDPALAKKFYTGLFGWRVQDMPIPDGSVYTMLTNPEGKHLCALYKQNQPGVPPHWGLYVAGNASELAKKAEALGGKVMAPPFDVMDVGRMTVLQDPTGAVIRVWEAKSHIGAQVVGVEGAFCWADLVTNNVDAAGKFYTGLFGWSYKPSPEYTEIQHAGHSIGGMMPLKKEWGQGIPSHWAVYFLTHDIDASTSKAKSLGATVKMPPDVVPNVGRWCVLQDPQGAHFNLYEPVKKT